MLIVICYDIPNDRRRTRLHKLLKSYGNPVQESVFEVFVDEVKWKQLRQKVLDMTMRGDLVRFYSLCERCQRQIDGTVDHPGGWKPRCVVI